MRINCYFSFPLDALRVLLSSTEWLSDQPTSQPTTVPLLAKLRYSGWRQIVGRGGKEQKPRELAILGYKFTYFRVAPPSFSGYSM